MAAKEGASLLPTLSTSFVKSAKAEERRFSIRKAVQWLHITTTALVVCWIAFHSFQQQEDSPPMTSLGVIRHLMTNQDGRERRQLGSGQRIIEDEIVVRHNSDLTSSSETVLDAPLANPDRLWPSGVVEYKFYHTFSTEKRRIVMEAMEYITAKVSSGDCIRFQEATESTEDYVLIRDGVDVCNSEVGRIGGEQVIKLSSGCFDEGLMGPVHELVHALGFVHEHTRPDRDSFVSVNFENIVKGKEKNFQKRPQGYSDFFPKDTVNAMNTPYDVLSLLHYGTQAFSKNGKATLTYLHGLPDETWPEPHYDDPLSIIDQVELAMAYKCEVSQEKLLQYIHFNRHYNTLLIQHNTKLINQLGTDMETSAGRKSLQPSSSSQLEGCDCHPGGTIFDPRCRNCGNDPWGCLGCQACGVQDCRFCGFDGFVDIPC